MVIVTTYLAPKSLFQVHLMTPLAARPLFWLTAIPSPMDGRLCLFYSPYAAACTALQLFLEVNSIHCHVS